ncbi:ATP synthase protein I [Musa troglodytarum]|uniref:ATP synthase protein I n=1 Tax=Musa troglodytarum TaxID=320322 RepID=A0A9E7H214_9LILI|nr:ATP synthase protein I [Musa troglodytarum]
MAGRTPLVVSRTDNEGRGSTCRQILGRERHGSGRETTMAALNASACAAFRSVVRSAADSPVDDPSPSLPTRVVLPKKKPLKWSTGVAPGEYGGPPTTTKLRKYWGGGDEDPVTATDDFIWNKEFLGRMQQLLGEDQATPNPVPSLQKEPDSGFLSLNRALSLDSIEIDLSKELKPPPKPVLEQQVEARNGLSATQGTNDPASPRWRLVPTRREQAKWDRASKATRWQSFQMIFSELVKCCRMLFYENQRGLVGIPRYWQPNHKSSILRYPPYCYLYADTILEGINNSLLKRKLQILTVSIGGIGVVSAYFSYSPEIAASFGAGLLGSLAYIRMLGTTVDSMANGAKGLVKGAAGQPRLFVPVVLVMMYNRWNGILVPDYGFMHLELIPMLVGFFTYKVATFAQAIEDALDVVERS